MELPSMQTGKPVGGMSLTTDELMCLLNKQMEISGGQLDSKSGIWKVRAGDKNLEVTGT